MNKPLRTGGAGGGKKSPTITQDNLLSKDIVEFTLGICEGPIGGLIAGGQSFYLDDTPLVSLSGQNNFEPFELHMYHGAEDASIVRNALGGISSNQQVGVSLATNSPVIRVTPSSLSGEIDRLEVRLFINSLVRSTSSGDQLDATVDFNIEYRQVGTTQWLNFNTNGTTETYISGYQTIPWAGGKDDIGSRREPIFSTVSYSNFRITGKTTGGYARDFVKQVPRINADWEIRVTLLTDTTNPLISVAMTWESIQSVTVRHRAYDNLAVARGLGQASDQFSGIPKFSGVYACLLVKVPSNFDPVTRHYDGVWDGTFKIAHTDDPAWITYDLCDHPLHGLRRHIPDLLLDRYSFYEASQWCNELVPIPGGAGYQPRYTCNLAINNTTIGPELVTFVASSFNAIFLSDMNGTIRLAVDQPGPVVQVFGPESVGEEGFQYQFTEIMQRYNDVEVEFMNPDLGWEPDRRRVFDQALIDANGSIPLKMVAVGCNNVHEAQRRAHLRMLQANTELSTVSFQTARAGISLELFDFIGISDPDVGWGVSGRVQSVVGMTVNLRDQLMLPHGVPLNMVVQTADGPITLVVTSPTPVTQTLTLSTIWPARIPEFAQFSITSEETGLVKPFRIVAIKPSDDDTDSMMITAVEVNVNKYGDADNLTSSGTVDYEGQLSVTPLAPTITSVRSGSAQLQRQGNTVLSRIRVEWSTDPRSNIQQVLVYHRQFESGAFQVLTANGSSAYIPNVVDGETYEIYLEGISSLGVRSASSPMVAHEVEGKSALPQAVTGLVASGQMQGIWLRWDRNNEADFSHFEIVETEDNNPLPVDVVPDYQTPANQFTRGGLDNAIRRYFWVRAVDTSGNRSAWSSPVDTFSFTLSQIEALAAIPTNLELTTALLFGTPFILATWSDVIGAASYEVEIVSPSAPTRIALAGTESFDFIANAGADYTVRVRSVNGVGGRSEWSATDTITAGQDEVPPAIPVGLTATGGVNMVFLRWTAVTDDDLDFYEIHYDTTATYPADLDPAGFQISSNFASINDLVSTSTYYFWVRAVDTSGNRSSWSTIASATPEILDVDLTIADGSITAGMFAAGIRPIEIVSSLPTTGNFEGRMVYLTTDNKTYRHTGSPVGSAGFTASVSATDIAGQVQAAQIAAVNAASVSGQITTTQIADDAITAPQIAANAVTAGAIAANAVTAGTIAANAVTAGTIAANAISATAIAADAVTAGKIAAGAVSADKIAANAITASKLFIGDRTNLITDGEMLDAAAWTFPAQFTRVTNTPATGFEGAGSFLYTHAGGAGYTGPLQSRKLPVSTASQYMFRYQIMAGAGVTHRTWARVHWFDAAEVEVGLYSNIQSGDDTGTGVPVSYFASLTPPATAVYAELRFYIERSFTTGNVSISSPSARLRSAGELIVDGAITADKIATNAVVAGKIAVGAVVAGTIAADAITTVNLQAATITTDKLVVNSVTNTTYGSNALTTNLIANAGIGPGLDHYVLVDCSVTLDQPTTLLMLATCDIQNTQNFNCYLEIEVDGVYYSTVTVPKSGDWSYPSYFPYYCQALLPVTSGAHTIRLMGRAGTILNGQRGRNATFLVLNLKR